ncbi:c-type cytochrome [Dokdonella soli]|uniref:Cytochrome c n=1 Tax=Dokdonella soli TaxID=529810 RepID=A0ABN1IN22_9GAMM
MSRRFGVAWFALVPLLLAALAVGGVLFLRQGGFAPYRVPAGATHPLTATPEQVGRGEYIARLGICATCHTTRGGVPFTGGRAFATGYGTIHSTNLTPDAQTGLGGWSVEEFRHTMRNGVSRHGVLYPVFPYAHFALLRDDDLDALFAYLQQLPATARAPTPNRLEFPASWRPALVAWRMLHYQPATPDGGAGESPQQRRGRYLVDGLGHCAMCHGARRSMGSLPAAGYLAGGRIPGLGWYAPPLDAQQLRRYSTAELADYLRSGTSPHGTVYGPMAEVVYGSLRHLTPDDALAMAVFLKSVPAHVAVPNSAEPAAGPNRDADSGADLYKRHCEDCHARDGRGTDKGPPLVDAVAVTAPDPANAVRMILYGAMPPTTAGNPRPHSMPPFVQQLDSAEIAAVANHIRMTWGDRHSNLSAGDIDALHGIDVD